MDWAMLGLQLMRAGAIGFRTADEINPEYINANCPPIAVLQSQAFEAPLLPIIFAYYLSRRNR